MTLALTIFLVLEVVVMTSRAKSEYRLFRALTTTEERQARYGRWALRSLLLYTLVPLGMLALIRALHAPLFYPLSLNVAVSSTARTILTGIAGGLCGGMLLGAILSMRHKGETPMLGDIADLLPRNAAERRYGALLSLNAGLGEELLFRLTLPLLLTRLGVPALIAFGVSAILFGLAHAYQGLSGIIGTMVLGSILTSLYVAWHQLWLVMVLHTLIDLNGLVLRPWLMQRTTRST